MSVERQTRVMMPHSRRMFLLRTSVMAFGGLVVVADPHETLAQDLRRRQCPESDCPYIYNPLFGDRYSNTPPGVPFEDLPDDWECPECGTPKYLW